MDATPGPDLDATGAAGTSAGFTPIIADFADAESALQSYRALQDIEDGHAVGVQGAIVVSRATDGTLTVQQVTDHSTRRGAMCGDRRRCRGSGVPPAVIATALVTGAAGAAIGKGAQVHRKHALDDDVQYAISPGHHGLVAVVSDPEAREIAYAYDKADRVLRKAVTDGDAEDIKTAARRSAGGRKDE